MMNTRALLLSVMVLFGCNFGEEPKVPSMPSESRKSASVPWVAARPPTGLSLLEAPASVPLPPNAEALLSPPVTTRVVSVKVQVGDRVEEGETLGEVSMPEVVEAAGRFASAKLRLDAQSKLLEKLRGLSPHGLVTAPELASAEAAVGEARAERVAARAILAGAGVTERDATEMLSRGGTFPLRSPISGVVLEVDAPLGAVREQGGSPLFRIGAEAAGRVVTRLAGAIPEGATFEWFVPGETPVPLALVSSSPLIDPRDGKREVFLQAEAPLSPGAAGTVRVLLPETSTATALPSRAVFLREGKSFVYLLQGGVVEEREVRVLASSGTEALVEGLSVGDRVAADAARYTASLASDGEGMP